MLSPTWIEWIIPLLVAFALCFHAISLSIIELDAGGESAGVEKPLSVDGMGGVESSIMSSL